MAVLVAEHLNFDMARAEKRALDQQPAVAEGARGLRAGGRAARRRVRPAR